MLDEEGAQFLINNHSDPDMVEDMILDAEMNDEDLYEFIRKNLIKRLMQE